MTARKKNTSKDGGSGSPAASSQPGGGGAEVAEERVEVVRYAAAVDVAKGSGMVCTRVPGSRPDRKRQTVWQVDATYASVVEPRRPAARSARRDIRCPAAGSRCAAVAASASRAGGMALAAWASSVSSRSGARSGLWGGWLRARVSVWSRWARAAPMPRTRTGRQDTAVVMAAGARGAWAWARRW
jgi:hypothetical protein